MTVGVVEGTNRRRYPDPFERVFRERYEMPWCRPDFLVVWERNPQEKAA